MHTGVNLKHLPVKEITVRIKISTFIYTAFHYYNAVFHFKGTFYNYRTCHTKHFRDTFVSIAMPEVMFHNLQGFADWRLSGGQ